MPQYIITALRDSRKVREDVFESTSMEVALAHAKHVWTDIGEVSWLAEQGEDYPGRVARITLKPDEKRALYRAGKYRFRAPPVCTALWDEQAWINYIDAGNGWCP